MSSLGPNPNEVWTVPNNKGWECPKCGKCWAPIIRGCTECNNPAGKGTVKHKETTDEQAPYER